MLRILVLTRSYPADDNLYQYPFVHRRVKAYLDAGADVAVFRQGEGQASDHRYDGVTCSTGGVEAFERKVAQERPDVVAVHGFCETMWPMLAGIAGRVPVCAWLHGSEIPEFFRQKAVRIADSRRRAEALAAVDRRAAFWREFLADAPSAFRLVFVSHTAVDLMRVDTGTLLRDDLFAVIANPIDTELFAYRRKAADDRFAVLSIRPFDSWTYGNDMTVGAILQLRGRAGFERMRFTIIGDGPLFDETLEPVRGMSNVKIARRFLSQQEIALEHGRNGIFLVPTRLDTHGVSRDEAMSSGLVAVTNRVSAVPEFVDESVAALAGDGDVQGLADALWRMVEDPQLFLETSPRGSQHIRAQVSVERIVPRELRLLANAAV